MPITDDDIIARDFASRQIQLLTNAMNLKKQEAARLELEIESHRQVLNLVLSRSSDGITSDMIAWLEDAIDLDGTQDQAGLDLLNHLKDL